MDSRAVRKLPDELATMAGKIKRINESMVISPVGVLRNWPSNSKSVLLEDEDPKYVVRSWARLGICRLVAFQFEYLPTLVQDYEACLRHILALLDEADLRFTQRQFGLLSLLMHVEEQTGKPQFSAVVDLVNAAFSAADMNYTVTSSSLEKLWKRRLIARMAIAPPKPTRPVNPR
jgi:hypothetical protein